jgi:hypothetical protein
MEAIWNYFYWQTLSSNALDDIGHVLRLGIVVDPACGSYQVKPSKELLDRCNQFLGPTQPGVTTPDPTRPGAATASAPARTAAPASKAVAAASKPLGSSDEQAALDYLLGE